MNPTPPASNTRSKDDSGDGSDAPRRSGRERKQTMTAALSSTRSKTATSSADKSPADNTRSKKTSKSAGKRKGNYHDNLVNSSTRVKQEKNKNALLQLGQMFIDLAEKPDLKITKVTHRVDRNGKSWPCIALANAPRILRLMKKINPDFKPEGYGSTRHSDESRLRIILISTLKFWEVQSISLADFEVKPPRGNDWKLLISHYLLEEDDYKNGRFDKTKVAKITGKLQKKTNPFEDANKKSKGGGERATISFRNTTIALKRNLTTEQAEKLRKDARRVINKMIKENPNVTKKQVEEALEGENIRSKRQPWGATAASKKK